MKTIDVTVTYLEMRSISELRRSSRMVDGLTLWRLTEPVPEFARFLYTAVGGEWYWIDRLPWARAEWLAHLARTDIETWVAYLGGAPCGYFELQHEPGNEIQLQYFGLFSAFFGRGIGGPLLTAALDRAWSSTPSRVWVNTCTLDHAAALANYEARGFRVYNRETSRREVSEEPPSVWPSSNTAPATEDTVA